MKRFIKLAVIIGLLLSTSQLSFAQVKYNVQAGLNFTEMTNNSLVSSKTGFRFGLGLNYNFSNNFSIDPSLLIVSKGFRQTNFSINVSPVYLQIPVNATLNLPLNEKISILIGVGPYVAYGIGGKGSFVDENNNRYNGEKLFSKNSFVSMLTYKNRFDAGLNANIGVMFGDIVVYAGGDFGFLPVNNLDFEDKNYNSGFYFMLSYRF